MADLLSFDCLSEAEKLTGISYKENDAVVGLGLALNINVSKQKEKLLSESFDTKLNNKLNYYLDVVTDLGFKVVYHREFLDREGKDTNHHYVMFNYELGILLNFDTYFKDSVNGGKYYYNILVNKDENGKAIYDSKVTSSGTMKDGIWYGDHDCREAIRFNINRLKQSGTFLTPWQKIPYVSLTNYMDWNKGGSNYVSEDVFSKLPLEVQSRISEKETP